jgi:hypothetical protein
MTAVTLRRLCRLLLAVGGLLASSPVFAQQLTVRGRVLGPDNNMLAAQRVVLHRVDASGGSTVAEDTSDAEGRFELNVAASTDTSAVYFIASRYEEQLYIGAPFRPGLGESTEQFLQVGVPGTSADQLMRGEAPPVQGGGRPATSRSWMLLLIPLAGVVAVSLYALLARNRISPERTLLIRVAELDERMATATDAQRETMRDERARMLAQLRGTS